jgi:hypothetical protein
MSQRPEFILSLAAKDGSLFLVDELRRVYAQVKNLHNPQLAMLEFTMVLPRERAQELMELLSEAKQDPEIAAMSPTS